MYNDHKFKLLSIMLPKTSAYVKCLKTKIKSHCDEVTDFYGQKTPKLASTQTCLPVISLDSALKKEENYYPQVFLKDRYVEKKVIRYINDNLSGFSSSDESDEK